MSLLKGLRMQFQVTLMGMELSRITDPLQSYKTNLIK